MSDKTESTADSSASSSTVSMGAWATIKKHKVVEWAIAYIAFGYAALHGVEMLREASPMASADSRLAKLLRFTDWRAVTGDEGELSGVAPRRVGVRRPFEHAVDEARWRTVEEGFHDERSEVMVHWMQAHTWIRAPILIVGDVLQSLVEYELLVGSTRLGNLLGALVDRQDSPEYGRHRVWLGRAVGL